MENEMEEEQAKTNGVLKAATILKPRNSRGFLIYINLVHEKKKTYCSPERINKPTTATIVFSDE
jgi:hypothetical protein